jgi:hypothetical protein
MNNSSNTPNLLFNTNNNIDGPLTLDLNKNLNTLKKEKEN